MGYRNQRPPYLFKQTCRDRQAPIPINDRRSRTCRDPDRSSLVDMGGNVVDRLLDSSDLLGLFIGDLALEFFLERHH